MDVTQTHRVFGGTLKFVKHDSISTGTEMALSVFIPDGAQNAPALIWLSGLTCTANNFTEKAGAYKYASEKGLVIIAPDTSPRGEDVANDEAYDLGQGAGFYIDATQDPWAPHFKMESYITRDLMDLIKVELPVDMNRIGISGHSMGGHGALTLAMKYPNLYKSVSAFAPIVAPSQVPWGEKAFTAYLGKDADWRAHDACALVEAGKAKPFDDILIDQGLGDSFLENQLKPELIEEAAQKAGQKITLRRHAGYDHSYYFMQSFIESHIAFHAKQLK